MSGIWKGLKSTRFRESNTLTTRTLRHYCNLRRGHLTALKTSFIKFILYNKLGDQLMKAHRAKKI